MGFYSHQSFEEINYRVFAGGSGGDDDDDSNFHF